MVPFPYHGMPMFSGNPEMSLQQQHFQRLQQLIMQQHQWEQGRLGPQYYNGHDISPTKIKVTNFASLRLSNSIFRSQAQQSAWQVPVRFHLVSIQKFTDRLLTQFSWKSANTRLLAPPPELISTSEFSEKSLKLDGIIFLFKNKLTRILEIRSAKTRRWCICAATRAQKSRASGARKSDFWSRKSKLKMSW